MQQLFSLNGQSIRIDWRIAKVKMRRPSWIFDARSITNQQDILDNDINIWTIGDGTIESK